MANDSSDINDFVKKCKILLLDIEGTTTSISFVKDKLFPYAEENVKGFLDSQWEDKRVQDAVAELRKLAIEDQEKAVDGVVTIPGEDASKEEQIEGLVKSVKWQMASDRKVSPLKQLQGLIWKQGYDKGEIKGHVYDDVSPALDLWRSVEDHKVYIYSSGSVQAQKLLFGQSSAGDLLPLIDGHFDTAIGAKQEESSYKAIAEKIGCKSDDILFLTDILKEAEAARSAGLSVALVSREGNAALPDDAASFPLLYSLEELAGSKKRKPDPQDEQPAKVPKTDVDDNVKTSSDPENSPKTVVETTKEEIEKMEVEDETNTIIEPAAKVETVVEEVTDTNEVVNVPIYDAQPVVEENIDNKTDEKETEKMDTDSSDLTESVSKPKEDVEEQNGDKVHFAEETPPTIITEISEITQDTESLNEVAEIIEDLEPIVEEPTTAQDIELQNVGDVLEKECDEILSKVQDVTNLDNIPLKPLLSTIAEETMDTDNTDTNDIVDGILDSEQEIEIRQRGDSDLNTVASASETKTVVQEGKGDGLATDKFLDEKSTEQVEHKAFENIGEKPAEKEIIDQNNTEEAKKIAEEKVEDKENTMSTNSVVEIKEVEDENNVNNSTESQTESSDVNKIKDVEQSEEKFETEKNKDKKERRIETEINFEMETNLVEAKANDKAEECKTPRQETEEKSAKSEGIDAKTEEMDVKTEVDAKTGEIDVKTEEIEAKTEEIDPKTEEIFAKPEKIDARIEEIDPKSEELNVKTEGGAMVTEESKAKSTDHKVEKQENKTEENVETKESAMETEQSQLENKATSADHRTMEMDPPAETNIAGEDKTDSEMTETQVNGKPTNGGGEITDLNGEACKDDELSSRLSLENGKEEVNGANGDVTDETKGQGDISTDTEVPDIKVKSVGTDEPCNDPIEQPTEA